MTETCKEKNKRTNKPSGQKKTPPLSQLCWNCKCSLNTKEHNCSWSRYGKPVKGWSAEVHYINEAYYPPMKTYCVTDCPLYQKDKLYMDHAELITYVAEKLGFCRVYIQRNYEKMLKRFEEETGEKLPQWAWEREFYKSKKSKETNGNG